MKNSHHPIITLLLLAFWLGACAEQEVSIPLSQEKMIDVLIDLHIAEAMLEKLPTTDQDTVGHVYYRMIFREHGVSEDDFRQSISVLREDPKRLNAIYEEIMGRLNVLEATERGLEKMDD